MFEKALNSFVSDFNFYEVADFKIKTEIETEEFDIQLKIINLSTDKIIYKCYLTSDSNVEDISRRVMFKTFVDFLKSSNSKNEI